MKQIFTLTTIVFVLVFSPKANSQNVSEDFATSAEVTALANSCWTFNNFNFSSDGTMQSQLGTTSELITPELQIPSSLTVSFSYNTVASNSGSKTLKIFISINGVETFLENINLNSDPSGTFTTAVPYTNANTPGNNINGSRKLIFRVNDNASVKFDNLSINAPYTYAGGCAFASIPLPVQLISFNGSLVNNKVQLKWFVAENELGDRFEIEKSADGRNFSTIGYVLPLSKNGTQDYLFNEGIELNGAGYYRLKIVNKSGAIVQSNIVVLKNDKASTASSLVVLKSKGSSVSFNYTSSVNGVYHVNVFSVTGAKILTSSITMQKGLNATSLEANRLMSNGIYVLEVTNGTDRSVTKFIK
jgi:hypothetical protein